MAGNVLSVAASVGWVSAHAPHDTHVEPLNPPASLHVRIESAAARRPRERTRHLVARADTPPERDARLVHEHQMQVAFVTADPVRAGQRCTSTPSHREGTGPCARAAPSRHTGQGPTAA
jgi:hypothetical protein